MNRALENKTLAIKGMSKCPACGEVKDLFEFPRSPAKPNGRASRCKPCTKPRPAAEKLRHNVKYQYGVTIEEYNDFLATPCDICGGKATVLDHCHATGKNRAGLCSNCNTGLGLYKDDPSRLRAAAEYLESHR